MVGRRHYKQASDWSVNKRCKHVKPYRVLYPPAMGPIFYRDTVHTGPDHLDIYHIALVSVSCYMLT